MESEYQAQWGDRYKIVSRRPAVDRRGQATPMYYCVKVVHVKPTDFCLAEGS